MKIKDTKTALIIGVTGQDGAYLSRYLLSLGYNVYGTSRDISSPNLWRLHKLGIIEFVQLVKLDVFTEERIKNLIIKIRPDEIYNLAGQSSVGHSFLNPKETFESNTNISLCILESIRILGLPIRLLLAGSSESFGSNEKTITEQTQRRPISPYGLAKYSVEEIGKLYRSTYDIFVSTAILFNHESPLRGESFVTTKIIKAAFEISFGRQQVLKLGNIKVSRDWGLAEEYVKGMFLILNHCTADDFILATGVSQSLENFVFLCFDYIGLNYKDYVEIDNSLRRLSDPNFIQADISKVTESLGWSPSFKGNDVVVHLMEGYKKMNYHNHY